MGIIQKIFGTRSEREVKKLMPLVTRIESMEDEMKALTDEQLREKTDEFRKRYQGGEDLDDLLPEAFAVCREAADRVLGMRPYRVQLIGGIVLHQGLPRPHGRPDRPRSQAGRAPRRLCCRYHLLHEQRARL